MARKSKAETMLDQEITKLYGETCSNIQIDIWDIPKVFDAARAARIEGRDMRQAIIDFVASVRKN